MLVDLNILNIFPIHGSSCSLLLYASRKTCDNQATTSY